MKVVVGHSDDVDSQDAVDEILRQCSEKLGALVPRAGILYAAADHEHRVLVDEVMKQYPELELIGCTTNGEISSVSGFAQDSVTLILFHSEKVSFSAGIGHNVREEPSLAARNSVEMAKSHVSESVKLCVTIPEGLGIDTAAILESLSKAVDEDVPICGGMSADDSDFVETFQFYKNGVFTDSIPVLLFSGPLFVSSAIASGWNPIGDKHAVTRSDGNVIWSIDNKPATELYLRYVQAHNANYPLAVYPHGTDDFYLCSPERFGNDGSIKFLNTVPQGALVSLADASRDQIISGAAESTTKAIENYPGSLPAAGLVFSCASRRAILGTRAEEEVESFREIITQDIPVAGFYCYGEICPLPSSPDPRSHNCTFVTVLIGEV